MVVVMKPEASQRDVDKLVAQFQLQGLQVGITNGVGCTILGLVGDTTGVDMDKISINNSVERVMRVSEPYKRANRKFHPEDTAVKVGGAVIGGGSFSVIAGPCSVESEAQIIGVAKQVQSSGAGPLSPAPPLIRSRAWGRRGWICCWRPRPPRVCPSSPS